MRGERRGSSRDAEGASKMAVACCGAALRASGLFDSISETGAVITDNGDGMNRRQTERSGTLTLKKEGKNNNSEKEKSVRTMIIRVQELQEDEIHDSAT